MRLSESDKNSIREMYMDGVSVPKIASDIGCSESSVWFYAKEIVGARRMQAYVAMKTRCLGLSEIDTGWVAGIVDGEGWVGIGRNKSFLGARISVSSTGKFMVPRFQSLIGGNICTKSACGNWRVQQTWDLYTLSTVRGFCEMVGPFLHVKAEQAKLLAEFCRSRMENRVKKYTDDEMLIVDRLSVLNRRGVEDGFQRDCREE